MSPNVRNIAAVIAGILIGSLVNMGIISISASVIPLPEGIVPGDMESLKANMHLFKPINFLMPFLAHALGAMSGAFITAKIALSHQLEYALGIGFFFLIGGIMASLMLPAPLWFTIVDLVGAYIPMAWFGGLLAVNESDKLKGFS